MSELTGSPINLLLLAAIVYLLYKILRPDPDPSSGGPPAPPPVPPLKKQDFTLQQLRQHDGTGEHGRVLVAVNGKVSTGLINFSSVYKRKLPFFGCFALIPDTCLC